jgi:hypothetical protein
VFEWDQFNPELFETGQNSEKLSVRLMREPTTWRMADIQIAAISPHMNKKMANRNIWWLSVFDD